MITGTAAKIKREEMKKAARRENKRWSSTVGEYTKESSG